MMKKTFYNNFLPTKAEEEAAIARGQPYQVTRTLIEIRRLDDDPPPVIDKQNPWQIRRLVTADDILTGRLPLSHREIFEFVFPNWSLDLCKFVVMGVPVSVTIADYTDGENPKRFESENIFIRGFNDEYVLGWTDIVQSRLLQAGDEIGLYWDVKSGRFGFKVLRRANSSQN